MKYIMVLLLSSVSLFSANPPFGGGISGGKALSSNDVVNIITNFSGNSFWFTNPTAPNSISNSYNVMSAQIFSAGTNYDKGAFHSTNLNPGFMAWAMPTLGDRNSATMLVGASATVGNTNYFFSDITASTNGAYFETMSINRGISTITAISRLRVGGDDVALNSFSTNSELLLRSMPQAGGSIRDRVRIHPTPTDAAQTPFSFDVWATRTGGTLFAISNNASRRFTISDDGDVVISGKITVASNIITTSGSYLGNGGSLTNVSTVGNGSGFVTNFGLVWFVTNDVPTETLPNGSFATVTTGRFFIRTNDTWLEK